MKKIDLPNFDQQRIIVARETGEEFVRDGRPIPHPMIPTSESVDRDALATLLYSGTVFPPATIFKGYCSLGLGGSLALADGKADYASAENLFDHDQSPLPQNFDCISNLAASMANDEIDFDKTTLLLSEGKDSTGIALAIAELGQKVDCLTFANSDTNVGFVESIAKRLGFRLTVVRYGNMQITDDSLDRLTRVFEPTLDQAFLSYLLLPMEALEGRTILDGMGNDIYMGHLPSKQQRQATSVCSAVAKVVPDSLRNRLRDISCSDRPSTGVPFRSFTECQGLFNGFSEALVQ
ncbi:MAG: hypothetical protein WBD31_28005 [Rubripirellula sp.]